MDNSKSIPVACMLTDAALSERKPVLQSILGRAQACQELDEGYRFTFNHEPELSSELLRLIEMERHCCQFLTFGLIYPAGSGTVELRLTGPEGTKSYLQSELGLV